MYYRRRADAERRQAQQAACPQAALIHATLALAYQSRLATLEAVSRTEHA